MINLLSFSSVMGQVGSIALAVLILLAMITIHEFGHYIAGKIFHFKIDEFAIGFGPAIIKKRRKSGELFALRVFPLGGYCAFRDESADSGDPGAFNNKKPWQRIIVLFSGAFMNYLLALTLILISFFSYGQLLLMTYEVELPSAESGITAEYCLQDRDVIVKVDGHNIYLTNDLMTRLQDRKAGDKVVFEVMRRAEDGSRSRETVEVALRCDTYFSSIQDTDTLWRSIGVKPRYSDNGEQSGWNIYTTTVRFGFFETVGRSFAYSGQIGSSIFKILGQLFTGKLGLNTLGGPITTIGVTASVASRSVQSFLEIAAYIGVNLAIFNLLPIPALDGMKIVFTAIEWVRGKPINRKFEAIFSAIGLVILIGFALIVDLLHLF